MVHRNLMVLSVIIFSIGLSVFFYPAVYYYYNPVPSDQIEREREFFKCYGPSLEEKIKIGCPFAKEIQGYSYPFMGFGITGIIVASFIHRKSKDNS